jgi:acyl dehydratase
MPSIVAELVTDYGRVDPDAAVAFALATNDRNDYYLRGLAVPPLFTGGLIRSVQGRTGLPSALSVIRGATGAVHGEHDVRFWAPVSPGESLLWTSAIQSMKQTRGGALVVIRILVTDEAGRPLVEHFWSNLHLGGTIAAGIGEDKSDHTFPESARARPVGRQAIVVDRDQSFRYAGVSGDHIGHAVDDEIARQEGYSGKILQGMCTFAMCCGAVVNLVAGGDALRLRRLAGRFSAPAYPGRDLIVEVSDAGESADGSLCLAFEASQQGTVVIKHGRGEVTPG